jgi:hypothetical protein
MVTHSITSRPVQCLCMAERTGCPVFTDLWSYVHEFPYMYDTYLASNPYPQCVVIICRAFIDLVGRPFGLTAPSDCVILQACNIW